MHRPVNTNKVGKQQNMLDKRKEKSRCAARDRRSKEKNQYDELAKLLPLPESIAKQLDKASIIRLTCSFLKYKDLIGVGGFLNVSHGNMIKMPGYENKSKKLKTSMALAIQKNLSCHLLRALDGFIFTVEDTGKILYTSDTIEDYLGLRPLDLIGTGIYSYIHRDDHAEFQQLLCSSFETNHSSDLFEDIDDFDAMDFQEMQRKKSQGFISIFIRMKCTLVKRGNVCAKSPGYKVIHMSGQMIPFRNLDCRGEQRYALVATGQILPPPTICELKLDTKVFVSRVSMDLRIAFCEGKIRKYMNFTAKDIVGLCAYEFYHDHDNTIVQDAHKDCLDTGKCISRAYRWMNKTGGWVWMQTVGTVISRNTPKGEEKQILCVNYIASDVEHTDEVMHAIQLRFKQLGVQDDNLEDYGIDESNGPIVPSDSLLPAAEAVDKDTLIKSITHYTSALKQTSNISEGPALPNPDVFGPNPVPLQSNIINPEMSPAEAFRCHTSDKLSTALLAAELRLNPLPVLYDPYPTSPLSASSHEQISPPGYSSNQQNHQSVYAARSTDVFHSEEAMTDDKFTFGQQQQQQFNHPPQRISSNEYMMVEPPMSSDKFPRLSSTLESFDSMNLNSNRSVNSFPTADITTNELAFIDAVNSADSSYQSPTHCSQHSPTYSCSYSPTYDTPSPPEIANLCAPPAQQNIFPLAIEYGKIEPGTSMECDSSHQMPHSYLENTNNNINLLRHQMQMQNRRVHPNLVQTKVEPMIGQQQTTGGIFLDPAFPPAEIVDNFEPISCIEPTIQNFFCETNRSTQYNTQYMQSNNLMKSSFSQVSTYSQR